MAKKLAFQFDDVLFACDMHKIDRARLYGAREIVVLDDQGDACELATLAGDGKTLIGKGGTGIGYLTADGEWTDKSRLTPVDLEGEAIQPVPSSFGNPIELAAIVGHEDFLNHNIRLVYRLEIEGALSESLFEQLNAGAVFGFPYSYRGGLQADQGFLLMNEKQELYFLVGDRTQVEFVGLQSLNQFAHDEPGLDADDLMDFEMI